MIVYHSTDMASVKLIYYRSTKVENKNSPIGIGKEVIVPVTPQEKFPEALQI